MHQTSQFTKLPDGNIEAVKQHLADGADVNAKLKAEKGRIFTGLLCILRLDPIAKKSLNYYSSADVNVEADNGLTFAYRQVLTRKSQNY